jgi:hypothetical protein
MLNKLWSPALLAFLILLFLQTSLSIIYKFAKESESHVYTFSQSGSMALIELVKLFVSIVILYFTRSVCSFFLTSKKQQETITSLCFVPWNERFSMMGLALGYTVNSHLAMYIFKTADFGSIGQVQCVSSVASALILWRLADRKFTTLQWVAVVLQMIGLVISQV